MLVLHRLQAQLPAGLSLILRVNDIIEQGQRIGMIRFGSRVDVTIPHDFDITVRKGERVLAGKTVIATIKNDRDF